MKVNIISDIHAVYDPKEDRVLYNLPCKYSEDKYLNACECLLNYWKDNLETLKKIDFKPEPIHMSFPECFVVKNHKLAIKWLEAFCNAAKSGFINVDKNKAFEFSRALTNIDYYCWHNKIIWNAKSKKKISVQLLTHWMFKHLYDFHPEKLETADYLIIAGDLGLDNTYDKILADITQRTTGKFKKILHIAGNHDHWWHGSQSKPGEERPDHPNFDRDYCEHQDGDYLFLGCTMWTPIPDDAVWRIERGMNDYNYTPGRFNPYVSRNQYEIQTSWLRNKIETNKDKKIIVFTHHQPFEELTLEDYQYRHNGKSWDSDNVNEAYVVMDHSLDDINKYGNIKLWCCGHTHQNFDGELHGVHVVRNPIGYGDLYDKIPAENPSWTWYNKIIEV